MRKLLLAIFFISFVQHSQGQSYSYVPFPSKDAGWVQFFESNFSSTSSICLEQTFAVGHDTTIGGFVYHTLELTTYSNPGMYGCAPPGNGTTTQSTYGAFRNDTLNKKVWLRRFSSQSQNDTLLYDFDLKLGDTLGSTFLIDSAAWLLEVTRVDTISLGGVLRREFVLGNSYCADSLATLIEGIGSTNGLTISPYAQWCLFGLAGLSCMRDSSGTIFPDTLTSCQLTTQILKEGIKPIQLSIFPNPTKELITISSTKAIKTVELFDIRGQKIIERMPLPQGSIQLKLEGSSGIYFLRLQFEDGSIRSAKVLKE